MRLLSLRCPQCNGSLTPENDHLVVSCGSCHTAVHISDEGLRRVPVHYARPREEATVTQWLPFWVFHGRVRVDERVVGRGGSSQEDMARLWGEPRDLYVPAWAMPPRKAQELGSEMIQRQPIYQTLAEPPPVPLTPVTLTTVDALKILDFIVLAIEAHRGDQLLRLAFQLDVGDAALWALPADKEVIVALDVTCWKHP